MIIALPNLEVHELDELPEQWRRFKLAWLCKELPSHNSGALIRILNAQKKWMRQEDTKNSGTVCIMLFCCSMCYLRSFTITLEVMQVRI
ncbi:hypothetical protein RchiOBHm_Chr6g0302241 [Rosa chinensis]|uniref:Uncharacterized protein n=1 Tax=Rosa chinensis TaxID=74649 RepID=A0A2P6PYZ0_ROSCH|nr:hypothetical protein RchiOBHm_Chr6g0302241 [Rosa chinensis]